MHDEIYNSHLVGKENLEENNDQHYVTTFKNFYQKKIEN
jgi:hypothetical protein